MRRILAATLLALVTTLGVAAPALAMDTNWPCKGCATTGR